MKKDRAFIRNFKAASRLETFLIAAIATILLIRLFLELTGYPKLGGERFHVAHMLWGGLLMMASILMLLIFLGKSMERMAVVVAGVGFGSFIDEVGKFLTHDNDYFFKPSVALMYAVFILIFIAIRSIRTRGHYTRLEYLMNALHESEAVAAGALAEEDKENIESLLSGSPPDHPLVSCLRRALAETETLRGRPPGVARRVKIALASFYRRAANTRLFRLGIVVFFLGQLLVSVSTVVVLVFFRGLRWNDARPMGIFDAIESRLLNLTFVDWAELGSSFVSAAFILLGIVFLPRDRQAALRMFERAVLISIFLTQVFIFYKEEFGALLGLALNLLVLAALRFMLEREEPRAGVAAPPPARNTGG
jgi:hypothetical protein